MLLARVKVAWSEYWEDTRGSMMVESVLSLPLLFWVMAATFEFFEVHRYKSVREKATYTVADILSRENSAAGITGTYLDNALVLFNEMSNDDNANQLRVSVIRFNGTDNKYEISWSHTRGTGPLTALTTADVQSAHSSLPILDNGEEIILVESQSHYNPLFDVGLDDFVIDTRIFTAIRFSPQLCFEGTCGPQA